MITLTLANNAEATAKRRVEQSSAKLSVTCQKSFKVAMNFLKQ